MVLRLIRGNGQRVLGPRDTRAHCGKKRYLAHKARFGRVLEVVVKCSNFSQLGPKPDWQYACVL